MTSRRSQITTTLLQFYEKPVAKVSSELLFSIFAVIFFAVFAIRPTILTMSDLIKEINDKQALEDQLTQKIAALSTVQTQYLNEQERLKVLDAALPSTPDLQGALLLIEKTASENNIAILEMEAKEVPQQDPTTIDFSKKARLSKPLLINITGTYPDIAQFVEGIRNLRREMVIESVSFTLADAQGKKQLSAKVTVSLQYFGVQSSVPGAATK